MSVPQLPSSLAPAGPASPFSDHRTQIGPADLPSPHAAVPSLPSRASFVVTAARVHPACTTTAIPKATVRKQSGPGPTAAPSFPWPEDSCHRTHAQFCPSTHRPPGQPGRSVQGRGLMPVRVQRTAQGHGLYSGTFSRTN